MSYAKASLPYHRERHTRHSRRDSKTLGHIRARSCNFVRATNATINSKSTRTDVAQDMSPSVSTLIRTNRAPELPQSVATIDRATACLHYDSFKRDYRALSSRHLRLLLLSHPPKAYTGAGSAFLSLRTYSAGICLTRILPQRPALGGGCVDVSRATF